MQPCTQINRPEFLTYALHSVSADDEHLSHIICQHLTGVTYVDSCLCVREGERADAF